MRGYLSFFSPVLKRRREDFFDMEQELRV